MKISTLFEKALNEEIQAICPTSEIEEEIEEVSILNRVAICMGMYGGILAIHMAYDYMTIWLSHVIT